MAISSLWVWTEKVLVVKSSLSVVSWNCHRLRLDSPEITILELSLHVLLKANILLICLIRWAVENA